MKHLLIALAMLVAGCSSRSSTILIDNDVCMLTRSELVDYFADVVNLVWDELDMPEKTEAELVSTLVAGALESCGHAPDGGSDG